MSGSERFVRAMDAKAREAQKGCEMFDSLMLSVHGEKNRERDMRALLLGEAAAHAMGQEYGPSEWDQRVIAMEAEAALKAAGAGPMQANFFLGGDPWKRVVYINFGGFELDIFEPRPGVLQVDGLPPGWFLVDAPYSAAMGGEVEIHHALIEEREMEAIKINQGCILVVSEADVHCASISTWSEEQLQNAADQREA